MHMRSIPSPHGSNSSMSRRAAFTLALLFSACQFDRADRWSFRPAEVAAPFCTPGMIRCNGALERCDDEGKTWVLADDCPKQGRVCSGSLRRCALCDPGSTRCNGQTVMGCAEDGESETTGMTCDGSRGIA